MSETPRSKGPPDGRPAASASRASRNLNLKERRERIVREAAPLFLDRGYENVSINDIVEAAGGSKATIYSLFGNKEGLFQEVVHWMSAQVIVSIDISAEGPMEQQLKRIGHSFLNLVLDRKIVEFHRLMVSLGKSFPDATRQFYEWGPETAYRNVAGWVARHQREGQLTNGNAYDMAAAFLDMLIFEPQLLLLTGSRAVIEPEDIERKVDMAVHLFLRGFSTSG